MIITAYVRKFNKIVTTKLGKKGERMNDNRTYIPTDYEIEEEVIVLQLIYWIKPTKATLSRIIRNQSCKQLLFPKFTSST